MGTARRPKPEWSWRRWRASCASEKKTTARSCSRAPAALRQVDPQTLPQEMAAHEPKGGRCLPLRPVQGTLLRLAEPGASARTAPGGRAHESKGYNLHTGYARYGADSSGARGEGVITRNKIAE